MAHRFSDVLMVVSKLIRICISLNITSLYSDKVRFLLQWKVLLPSDPNSQFCQPAVLFWNCCSADCLACSSFRSHRFTGSRCSMAPVWGQSMPVGVALSPFESVKRERICGRFCHRPCGSHWYAHFFLAFYTITRSHYLFIISILLSYMHHNL